MAEADDLLDILGVLSRADSFSALGHLVILQARRTIPGTARGMYVFRPDSLLVEESVTSGVSDFFLSRYEDVGRSNDPLLAGLISEQLTVDSSTLIGWNAWRQTTIYRDVYSLHGFGQALQAPILLDGQVVGTLNFGGEDPASFGSSEFTRATLLGRIAGVALSTARTQRDLARERDHARLVLELTDRAAIVSDARTGLRYANAAARRMQDELGYADSFVWLENLLADATPAGEGRLVELSGPHGTVMTIHLHTIVPASDPAVTICFLALTHGSASSPAAPPLTGLSKRERAVAELVAAGLRDSEVAIRMYLSPFTVKGHLKSVYRKLGVRSRVELARVLISNSSQRSSPPLPEDPPTTGRTSGSR